jgi:hypothetical protein
VKPEINAICTIMIAAVALGLVVTALVVKFNALGGARPAVKN